MEVILLEKIRNFGSLGDKISVKPGFARNYLVPQKKAVFATEQNIARFEAKRAEYEKKEKQKLADAEKRAKMLNATSLTITAQASEEGKLYGSIGVSEIKTALTEKSIEVDRREIILTEGPINFIGEYTVEIYTHSDVVAEVNVEVVAAK